MPLKTTDVLLAKLGAVREGAELKRLPSVAAVRAGIQRAEAALKSAKGKARRVLEVRINMLRRLLKKLEQG
jgi:hypothetical protein